MCQLRKLPEGKLIQNAVADGLAEERDRLCAHGHHWVILFDHGLYHAWSCACPDTIAAPVETGPTLANFRQEFQPQAFRAVQSFANAFRPTARRDAILTGGTGAGKTHLARGVMAFCRAKRYRVEFVQAAGLMRVFLDRESWTDDYQARQEAKEKRIQFSNADLLIVDDLGSERATKTEMFHQALLEFWDERRGSWLITTNLTVPALRERYGEKLHSRFSQFSELIQFTGRDFRQAGA